MPRLSARRERVVTTNHRQSSLYTLRLNAAGARAALTELVEALGELGLPVTDQHVASEEGHSYCAIGFRAADDVEAMDVAEDLLRMTGWSEGRASMTTGFGVHRRKVAF
jgi:hypothetical protein